MIKNSRKEKEGDELFKIKTKKNLHCLPGN